MGILFKLKQILLGILDGSNFITLTKNRKNYFWGDQRIPYLKYKQWATRRNIHILQKWKKNDEIAPPPISSKIVVVNNLNEWLCVLCIKEFCSSFLFSNYFLLHHSSFTTKVRILWFSVKVHTTRKAANFDRLISTGSYFRP